MNTLKHILKRILPSWITRKIKSFLDLVKKRQVISKVKKQLNLIHSKYERAIIIVATPVHGNLGDHAIVYAEYCFFKDLGLEDRILEISGDDYSFCKKDLNRMLFQKDLIVIDGGGNLGVLWPWEDDKISEIILSYKRNPILIFPQTCFYTNDEDSRRRLDNNEIIYSKSGNLLITLRDKKSFDFCRVHFTHTKCELVPDIVLYLLGRMEFAFEMRREGILFCFRKDLERVVSVNEIEQIRSYAKGLQIPYKEISTVKEYRIDRNSRISELNAIWKDFASAKLVVTDRLHGMIFAAINGTPCLALDNISKKVSGVWEMLSELNYIKVCSDMNEIIENIVAYYSFEVPIKNIGTLSSKYQVIKEFIENNISN